jgi:hypothetical protein
MGFGIANYTRQVILDKFVDGAIAGLAVGPRDQFLSWRDDSRSADP